MRSERISLAIDSGALVLPDHGTIAVLHPQAPRDLSALPAERMVVVQPMRRLHDALAAQGLSVHPGLPPGLHAAAVVCLPRARDLGRALVAEAVAAVGPGGLVVVDGQKTDGVEAMLRDLARHVALSEPVVKAHGRLVSFVAGQVPEDWRAAPRRVQGGFVTRPGVFSADGPDRGSALLAQALPGDLRGAGIDLGAGWGYLARAVLARPGVARLDLVEADAVALGCARENLPDPRATFHWADATTFRPARLADWVVCNPPFHVGRAADPSLGLAFIEAAARMLAPHGTLWLVANRHLPYDRALTSLFREVADIGHDTAFRVTRAVRPQSSARKAPQP